MPHGALLLNSLEGALGTRETLFALCTTYRSCELANLSPTDVFGAVASVLPADDADELRSFLRRRPEDRALSAFWLAERVNADGEIEIHLLLLKDPKW